MSPELRDLIERNHEVQQMTQTKGWDLLQDYLRAQLEAKQRAVIIGNPKDMEEYRKITGWIAGVMDALEAPAALQEQVDRTIALEEAEERRKMEEQAEVTA